MKALVIGFRIALILLATIFALGVTVVGIVAGVSPALSGLCGVLTGIAFAMVMIPKIR